MVSSAQHAYRRMPQRVVTSHNLTFDLLCRGQDVTAEGPDPNNPVLLECPGRNNLAFCNGGQGDGVDGRFICYFVSGLGIVMDIHARIQAFYRGHDGIISAMARHPAGSLIATSQAPSHANSSSIIHVWSSAKVGRCCPERDCCPEMLSRARFWETCGQKEHSRAYAEHLAHRSPKCSASALVSSLT